MSSLVFLVAFVLLSLLGGLLLWWKERAPRSMDAHIRAFERELHALSPDTPILPEPRRRRAHRPPPARGRPPSRPAERPRTRGSRPG